jgi:hypothetical protein
VVNVAPESSGDCMHEMPGGSQFAITRLAYCCFLTAAWV